MNIYPKDFCIFVASHVSKEQRLDYLTICLKSLIYQELKIPIYLSISFENELLKEGFEKQHSEFDNLCSFLNVNYMKDKTSQMRHYYELLKKNGNKHKWIMFCDDDDTYEPTRTFLFAKYLTYGEEQVEKPKYIMSGAYEGEENHRQKRHEYWTYCVKNTIMNEFYKGIENHAEIIDNKCCDVLFGEFLRRKNENHIFLQIKHKCYNYRIEENSGSITAFIQSKQNKYTINSKPPAEEDENWEKYKNDWESFVLENIEIFLHDTYLKTIVGFTLEDIIKGEFLHNYKLLDKINNEPKERIEKLYYYLRSVCNKIFDTKLS